MPPALRTSPPAEAPRAALAMSDDTAAALLGPEAQDRLARLTRLAPGPPLDDFTTEHARRALADADLLVTGWGCPPLDAAALDAAPRLRAVVHTAGTVRHHLTTACWERGVEVSSAAAANALPVAEYTLAAILQANKRVQEAAREYRAARSRTPLRPEPHLGNYRRTVGIVSASLVGRRVMELLAAHDMEVLLHDPYVDADEAAALGARLATLPQLFAASDVVSLHTPLLPATRGLVDAELLAAMPQHATLINTARGGVVDQEALTEALLAGRIRAVLDVTEPEVLPPDHPLWECEHVLLTPHLAGSLGNELHRLADAAVDEVARWAAGEGFAHPVGREGLAVRA